MQLQILLYEGTFLSSEDMIRILHALDHYKIESFPLIIFVYRLFGST